MEYSPSPTPPNTSTNVPDPSPNPQPEPLNGYSPNSPIPSFSTSISDNSSTDQTVDQMDPHGALFLVLPYLRLPELFAFQRLCRLFRDTIAEDGLLWQHIAVEPPLSGKLTDDTLLRITSKATGKLRSLALLDCWKITDAGLQQVVDQNSSITKLYVPGCTYLTADGVVRIVKRLEEHKGSLKRLRLRGLCNITKEHLDILKSYLCKNYPQQDSQPYFYNYCRSLPLNSDDGRPIDIDICPRCKNARLVFDCTREDCRSKRNRWTECRGCFFCIARCEECGGCVDFEELGEETVCSHLLCMECWVRLPKCNMCNRPYCKGHASHQGESSGSSGFICERCREREASSSSTW